MKCLCTCFFICICISTVVLSSSVALIIDQAGINDNSFNSIAFNGLCAAENEFSISVNVYTASTENEHATLVQAIKEHNDLIIVLGYSLKHALEDIARKYPKQQFALIDSTSDIPNIISVIFRDNEGSFLCGYLAAHMTKTGVIGFVGGQKNPVIDNFLSGYKHGAEYSGKDARVISYFIGDSANAWIDPVAGYRLAVKLHNENADIIFHAAGNSGLGVIKAAHDNKIFAIGVDNDQDGIAPKTVLTSMLKRVDIAVYNIIRDFIGNKIPRSKIYSLGIREYAIGLTQFKYTKDIIPASVRIDLSLLKLKILRNSLKVGK
jgi:basic membrane protein A